MKLCLTKYHKYNIQYETIIISGAAQCGVIVLLWTKPFYFFYTQNRHDDAYYSIILLYVMITLFKDGSFNVFQLM